MAEAFRQSGQHKRVHKCNVMKRDCGCNLSFFLIFKNHDDSICVRELTSFSCRESGKDKVCLKTGILRKKARVGAKDTLCKSYMKKPEHFADAFNYYLFGGKHVVKPELLVELDPTEIGNLIQNDSNAFTQKIRDALKRCVIKRDEQATYVVLGIENQTEIHYAMPVRNLIYDALNYGQQVKHIADRHKKEKDLKRSEFLSGFAKTDKITPVITLVVYFGAEVWDAPRTLHDMFEPVDEDILKYVDNYHLHLIVPKEIEDFELFSSELGKVLKFISVSDEKEEVKRIAMSSEYREIDADTAQLINACANLDFKIDQKEGKTDMMCKGMEDWKEELLSEGRAEGKAEGRAESTIELLEELGSVSIDLKEKIMQQKDSDILKRWLKLSARVGSIEEFINAM